MRGSESRNAVLFTSLLMLFLGSSVVHAQSASPFNCWAPDYETIVYAVSGEDEDMAHAQAWLDADYDCTMHCEPRLVNWNCSSSSSTSSAPEDTGDVSAYAEDPGMMEPADPGMMEPGDPGMMEPADLYGMGETGDPGTLGGGPAEPEAMMLSGVTCTAEFACEYEICSAKEPQVEIWARKVRNPNTGWVSCIIDLNDPFFKHQWVKAVNKDMYTGQNCDVFHAGSCDEGDASLCCDDDPAACASAGACLVETCMPTVSADDLESEVQRCNAACPAAEGDDWDPCGERIDECRGVETPGNNSCIEMADCVARCLGCEGISAETFACEPEYLLPGWPL